MKAEEALQLAKAYARKVSGGGGTSASCTADWDALEGEEGYIKNRPFYSNRSVADVLPETTVQLSDGASLSVQYTELLVGETYTIIIDGESYNCVCEKASIDGIASYALGSTSFFETGELLEEYPFLFFTTLEVVDSFGGKISGIAIGKYFGSETSEATISITGNCDVVKKLDEKYLPLDWIPKLDGEEELLSGTYKNYASLDGISMSDFEIGDPVYVYFDNVRYETSVVGDDSALFFGNDALVNSDNVDNGMPFLVYISNAGARLFTEGNVKYYVQICKQKYNKMPSGYLPDGIEPLPESFPSITLYDSTEGAEYELTVSMLGDLKLAHKDNGDIAIRIPSFDSTYKAGYVLQYNGDLATTSWVSPTTIMYNAAKDCGYTGTEEEFAEKFMSLLNTENGNEVAY